MRDDGFNKLEVPVYTSPQERIDRIYHATMQKIDLPEVRRIPNRRLFLFAAIISVGILTAAASFVSASDVFRGYLNAYNASEESTSLGSLSHIIDKTGTVLNVPSSTSAGIIITPKAIAGDDCSFVILFELESTDGTPLGMDRSDSSIYDGRIMFGGSKQLSHASGTADDLFSQGMDSRINGSSGILIQRFDLYEPVSIGDTIHIQLSELRQMRDMPGDDIGLGQSVLSDLISIFPVADQDSLATIDSLNPKGQGGPAIEPGDLALKEDSDQSIPLTGPLAGYTLTNAAVYNGCLYLRGYAPTDADPNRDLRNAALVNRDGGFERMHRIYYGSRENSGILPWGIVFQGIVSAEQLQDISLMVNYGVRSYPFAEGNWSFDIPLTYSSVSRDVVPDASIQMNGVDGTLTKLVLSPYRVTFDFEPDSATAQALEQACAYPYHEMMLVTEDGASIRPDLQDIDVVEGRLVRGYYYLNDVVDPAQVVAFRYGEFVYPLE